MATSGTIGNTLLNTAKITEKALRRCGLAVQMITPEIVETSKEDLFMLLMSLSNRGLNLWCIDRQLMGLSPGKKTYVLPVGTTDVLNLLLCTPSRGDATLVVDATTATATTTEDLTILRYGVKFSTLPTASFVFQSSPDGVTWVTQQTITDLPTSVEEFKWYELDPSLRGSYFRVHSATLGVVTDLYLVTQISEIELSSLNRDDYAGQPNKDSQSNSSLSYWFEKLVAPQITLWPVPSEDTRHLSLFRYRQIQDIGTLTEEIELPVRWLEAITWHLAARLAFEVPGVEPARRAEIIAMANVMVIEVEAGETDSAPTYFAPNISCYTK